MDFDEYQERAISTAVFPGQGEFTGLAYAALGLNGEAGEVAEKIKKLWRDHAQHEKRTWVDRLLRRKLAPFQIPEDLKPLLRKEAGDVLWYLAILIWLLDTKFNDVAEENIVKLASRKTRNVLHGSGDER